MDCQGSFLIKIFILYGNFYRKMQERMDEEVF